MGLKLRSLAEQGSILKVNQKQLQDRSLGLTKFTNNEIIKGELEKLEQGHHNQWRPLGTQFVTKDLDKMNETVPIGVASMTVNNNHVVVSLSLYIICIKVNSILYLEQRSHFVLWTHWK